APARSPPVTTDPPDATVPGTAPGAAPSGAASGAVGSGGSTGVEVVPVQRGTVVPGGGQQPFFVESRP
ncbi:hypothetical protein I4I83_06245, partial [Acidovorax cattleyae]|nr:hypothetical protein [Paracidovorax cattleyae]